METLPHSEIDKALKKQHLFQVYQNAECFHNEIDPSILVGYFNMGTHVAIDNPKYFPIGFAEGIKEENFMKIQEPK